MDLSAGVSLGQLVLTIGTTLVLCGIAWGGLLQRVKTLEREIEALSGFAVDLATMKTEIGHIKNGINQITGSWLFREPPAYDELERPLSPPVPRTRRPR